MSDQIKWLMGIVAGLFVAGATAWAGHQQTQLDGLTERLGVIESTWASELGQIKVHLQYIRADISDLKKGKQ